MSKRLRVVDKDHSCCISLCDFAASSKKAFRQQLEELLRDLSDDATFEEEYDFYDNSSLKITSFRDETDKEVARRLAKTKRQRAKSKAINLQNKLNQIEKLKAQAARLDFDLTPRKQDRGDWFRDDGGDRA